METPAGIFPINIRAVTCEKYGMKTGPGASDYCTHKWLKKQDIMSEIQLLGKMSDFEPGRKLIEPLDREEILFVVDLKEKYGEIMFFCFTTESEEIYKQQFQDLLDQEQQANESDSSNDVIDMSHVFYEDRPLSPRAWASNTSLETSLEIEELSKSSSTTKSSVSSSRLRIQRKKSTLQRPTNFSLCEGGSVHLAPKRLTNMTTTRCKEKDFSFQAIAPMQDAEIQTIRHAPISQDTQYEFQSLSDDQKNSIFVGSEQGASERFLHFLSRSTKLMTNHLEQNANNKIFHDTFQLLDDFDKDGNPIVELDNSLKEIKNFADPKYSKSKIIAAIDWLPTSSEFVAISVVNNINFDQRLIVSGQSHPAHVLLWNFKQLVKPVAILQSPAEIFTLRFNRSNPNILIGGCITGQVVLWDLTKQLQAHMNLKKGKSDSSGQMDEGDGTENGDDSTDETGVPKASAGVLLQPKYISILDRSHKKAISNLFWLPPNTQINYRGELVSEHYTTTESNQFITIAPDGLAMVWDIRYEEIFRDELKHIARSKHIYQEKVMSKEGHYVRPQWSPIFVAHLKRLEGVGEVGLCLLSHCPNVVKNVQSPRSNDVRAQFAMCTEEGDLLLSDLCINKPVSQEGNKNNNNTNNNSNANSGGTHEDDDGSDDRQDFVKWMVSDHARPPVCLQHSPFFADIVLTVSDWKFNIWRLGETLPLFTSPLTHVYFTCAAWSPTRPSVIYIGCSNGVIDVWDFSDSSVKPSLQLVATTPAKLTSMEFLAPSSSHTSTNHMRTQLLACGDDGGTLHIFEIPRTLMRPASNENQLMDLFLKKQAEQHLEEQRREEQVKKLRGNHDGANLDDDKQAVAIEVPKKVAAMRSTKDGVNVNDNETEEEREMKREDAEYDLIESKFLKELNLAD